MVRSLLVVRHAKSSWDDASLPDRERPLTKRGRRDAVWLGEELVRLDLRPDLILMSTARRARSTARRLGEATGYAGVLREEAALYLTDVGTHLRVLAALPSDIQRPLLVGHNPALEDLVHHLAGRALRLSTASLVCLDLAVADWCELAEGAGAAVRLTLQGGEP